MFFWSLFGFASLSVTINLMFAMKRHQNFEYRLHRSRIGLKSLAVILTIFIEVGTVCFTAFILLRTKTKIQIFGIQQTMKELFINLKLHENNIW